MIPDQNFGLPAARRVPARRCNESSNEMVAAGVLRRIGDGRGMRYARADADAGAPLSARQQRILRQVEDAGRITRLECADTTGASLRTASRDLRQLVEISCRPCPWSIPWNPSFAFPQSCRSAATRPWCRKAVNSGSLKNTAQRSPAEWSRR